MMKSEGFKDLQTQDNIIWYGINQHEYYVLIVQTHERTTSCKSLPPVVI